MLGTILGWLGNLLGGPFARAGVDAYRVKLDATTSSERVTADLAGRELAVEQREAELRAQVLIAEQGNAATRWVRPRWALPFIAWTWKVVRTASVRRRASRPSRYRSWDIVASFNSRCESYDLAAQRIAIRP